MAKRRYEFPEGIALLRFNAYHPNPPLDEETRKKVHNVLAREFDEELQARTNELSTIEARINQTAKLLQQIKHVVLETGMHIKTYTYKKIG